MGTPRFTYCPWPGDCSDLCFDLFIQSFARDESGPSIHKRQSCRELHFNNIDLSILKIIHPYSPWPDEFLRHRAESTQ